MRYTVISESTEVKPKLTNDVGAAFDHMVAENRRTGQIVEIWNRNTGKMLRSRGVVEVDLSGIKLTDAMRKALDAATSDGVSGAANTLKALATRGLVEVDKGGYRLSSLGRQYRAQRKGA